MKCGDECHSILIGEKTRAQRIEVTANEVFWIQVIRQASGDADPPPTLDRVHQLRAVFRPPQNALLPAVEQGGAARAAVGGEPQVGGQ